MPSANRFEPDWASPPGDTVSAVLEERDISTHEFSRMLAKPPEVIDQLLEGRLEIGEELAEQLSQVIGASPEFWCSREANFRASLCRLEGRIASKDSQTWLQSVPFREMASFGWVQATRRPPERLSECLRFFGVPDVESWQRRYEPVLQNVALRTSAAFESTPITVAAWLRQGEIEASKIVRNPWDADVFQDSLVEIRTLTRESDPTRFIPALQKLGASAGVSVVVVRAPTGCRASGATRFVTLDHPMLLLSARHLSDDHFWFTFFHEAGHLILHGQSDLFLEFDSSLDSPKEVEANSFAQGVLIPEDHREEFLQLGSNVRQIARFARRIGVSAGVVVGQLQHCDVLKPGYLNKMKRRFRWDGSLLVSKN